MQIVFYSAYILNTSYENISYFRELIRFDLLCTSIIFVKLNLYIFVNFKILNYQSFINMNITMYLLNVN